VQATRAFAICQTVRPPKISPLLDLTRSTRVTKFREQAGPCSLCCDLSRHGASRLSRGKHVQNAGKMLTHTRGVSASIILARRSPRIRKYRHYSYWAPNTQPLPSASLVSPPLCARISSAQLLSDAIVPRFHPFDRLSFLKNSESKKNQNLVLEGTKVYLQ